MSNAYSSGLSVKQNTTAVPATYTSIPEVISLSGLGKTNSLIDVTNFDSNGSKEYIAGLADGTEISLECNHIPGDTEQGLLIADVNAKTNRGFEVTLTDGTTPEVYTFDVTPLSWAVNPSIDDKNTLSFTLKISGDITVA